MKNSVKNKAKEQKTKKSELLDILKNFYLGTPGSFFCKKGSNIAPNLILLYYNKSLIVNFTLKLYYV